MYRKKTTIIIVMCIAMVIMGVGYALLSTKLNIGGSTAVTSSWKVEFSAIRTANLKGGATNKITPSITATTATFSVDLVQPGDEATYEIDITNYGDIKAEIKGATYSVTGSEAIYVEIDGIRKGTTIDHCEGIEVCPFITAIIKVGYNPAVESNPTQKTKTIDITLDIGQYVEGSPTEDGELIPELVVNDTLVQQILRDNSVQSDVGIDFSQPSSDTNGKGLYYTSNNTENNQVTYYFRGAVENNYVSLGSRETGTCMYNNKIVYNDMSQQISDEQTCLQATSVCETADSYTYGPEWLCYGTLAGEMVSITPTWQTSTVDRIWRIVRINEDGSVRLVTVDSVGTSSYNSNSGVDNAYVGYMYGTASTTTYKDTHENVNDSSIKTYLDNWYVSNLNNYSNLIADAGFCNDRSTASTAGMWDSLDTTLGYGINTTYYGSYNRINNSSGPQFACPQTNDLFTTKTSNKGNKDLTYPIGLLTKDELVYTGKTLNGWTMTPNFVNEQGVAVWGYNMMSGSNYDMPYMSNYVYPVINLKADVKFTLEGTGDAGTSTNPYVIKTN